MRADNQGEGGILALMTITGADWAGRGRALNHNGLVWCSPHLRRRNYYARDLGSERGRRSKRRNKHIQTVHDANCPGRFVVLFAIQHRGTGVVGKAFGPVMFIWLPRSRSLALSELFIHPHVLAAINPVYGAQLVMNHGFLGFTVLGGVFLALTGGGSALR